VYFVGGYRFLRNSFFAIKNKPIFSKTPKRDFGVLAGALAPAIKLKNKKSK
jgi:hypothetical protein